MTRLTEYARAKVNLTLHVGPVKPNGRHDLQSLVTFSGKDVSDVLEAEPASNFSLAVEGPFAKQAGPAKDNLVLRAARALNEALDGTAPPLGFRLKKQLPCAAGIGGGSADAAAALRILVRAHGGDRVMDVARQVAPELGGDVLACLVGLPGMMSGEGNVYEPMLGIPLLPAILVNPLTECPTGPVFGAFDAHGGTMQAHPLPKAGRARDEDFKTYLKTSTINALEGPALSLVPEIGSVLEALNGLPDVRLVRMSGSGATCFALFDTYDCAEQALAVLQETHQNWWMAVTMLGGG